MAVDVGAAHESHEVVVDEDVGALRRRVVALTAADAEVSGRAALIATELGTNLVHHGGGGYVLVRRLTGGVELVAVDRGPGLPRGIGPVPTDGPAPVDGDRALKDGLGVGLAGVHRMADVFDVYSAPGGGTVVLARVGAGGPAAGGWRWGAVNVPGPGESCSGDGWAVAVDGRLGAVVVDGLGHGPHAAEASAAALAELRDDGLADVAGFVLRAHAAMQGTRGAVLSVCAVDAGAGQVVHAGVGNVLVRVFREGSRETLIPRDGTLGTHLRAPRPRPGGSGWGPGATLILASDGLRSDWDPRGYDGLLGHDPTVVAAILHRDFTRGTDDATVLVVAGPPPASRRGGPG